MYVDMFTTKPLHFSLGLLTHEFFGIHLKSLDADDSCSPVLALPTALWGIEIFVRNNVVNTFFQACRRGFMRGVNRFGCLSWTTGLFIGLACIVPGLAGIVMFLEGKEIKRINGLL